MTCSIIAIGTAVPENQIPQSKVVEFMAKAHGLTGPGLTRLRALYRATGIKNRYSAIPDYALGTHGRQFYSEKDNLDPFPTTKERSEFYRNEAIKLSLSSSIDCLNQTQVDAKEVTHLITISCTGMYAPGLDIDLVNQLGLSKNVERTCINFMGCYAAFVGIKSAKAFCDANPKAKVLVVATELCTLHFQRGSDEDNLVANAIFGDGSAALLLSNEKNQKDSLVALKPLAFHNELFPEGADEMAWNIGNFGYEMKLSTYVPSLIEKGIDQLVKRLRDKASINTIQHFAFHPGGKRILEVIEQELRINKDQDWAGREVLNEYGNMSSPTVLFVLKKILDSLQHNQKGDKVLSLAFGPGLTVESMVLEVV